LVTVGVVLLLLVLAALMAYTPVGRIAPAIAAAAKGAFSWAVLNRGLLAMVAMGLAALVVLCYLVLQVHGLFNRAFEAVRMVYGGLLDWALAHRLAVVVGFLILVVASCFLFPVLGTDFFPTVDAGQIRLHVRAAPGTRIEETAEEYAQVEKVIRQTIPHDEVATVLDNMGIPNSTINLELSDGSIMSPADGEILVALNEKHHPTADYIRALRQKLPREFPTMKFFFAPADIVTQVLNFGLPASVDIQVRSLPWNLEKDAVLAQQLSNEVAKLPGIVDVHMAQVPNTPDIRVNVDRTLASLVGVSQRDVASDLLVSLSSSNQTSPNYWVSPANGVNYNVYVQTPQYAMNTINDLENTPIVPTSAAPLAGNTQLLVNLASTARGTSATNVTHFNIKPTFDVQMGVQGTDLGSAGRELESVIAKYRALLPRGSQISLRGQIESMNASFTGLGFGLIFAVTLVYLLLVINFQSWVDPLIILMALPGALSGILWMLWATHTTISVPALMGAIMSIGVATANSILMITFANDQRKVGLNARDASLAAGMTRLRPVMMTALAMIIGMLPMSLGLGEGGEQNAPLGRAVIGGLGMATFATLFFVPVVYSLLRRTAPETHVEKELM
jgi:multidrug efflux pump subunit AcrB